MVNPQIKAKRITRTYCQTINASPETIFPLLCPVREGEWLDGWQHRMIYSESDLVEAGAVFSTPHENEEDTVWVVTKHDPGKCLIEFTRFTYQSRTCVLKISVRPRDDCKSHVDISYTYTSISASGNDYIDNLSEETFREDMMFWEESMNYFLKTGDRLKKA